MSIHISAWNIPGWTAQNRAYPEEIPVLTVLPDGVRRVLLTEYYVGGRGTAHGLVTLTPQTQRVAVDDVEVLLQPVRSQLVNGLLSIEILVPPVGDVVWQVREAVGPQRTSYYIKVPADALDQELSDLDRVDSDGQTIT